jgi:hypothetical protein
VSLVRPRVEVFFDLSTVGGDFFTLNDPVKGKLNDPTFLLAGDIAVDITDDVTSVAVRRGRSEELDQISAGTVQVRIDNQDGFFWPSPLGDESRFGTGNIVPGKRVRVSVGATPVFDGFIEDWDFEYTADGRVTASFTGSDAFARLAKREFAEFTATSGQTTGERIDEVLSRPEVGFPVNRDLDVGQAELQGDTLSEGTNVLSYCQLLARCEVGRFFVSAAGVLTFRDRLSLVNPDPQVVFSDDCSGSQVRFQEIDVVYGSENLYNRVTVEADGGTAQTVTAPDSIAKYGTRALSFTGLPLVDDSEANRNAQFYLSRFREPELRVAALTVVLDGLPAADRADVLKLDIGSPVAVEWTPPGGTTVTQSSVVEGVTHDVSSTGLYRMILALSPLSNELVFILNDPQLGQLDFGGVLAF